MALIPAALFLALNVVDTIAMQTKLKRNPKIDANIKHKFSAQLPDGEGNYGSQAARDSVCVFMIGAKFHA